MVKQVHKHHMPLSLLMIKVEHTLVVVTQVSTFGQVILSKKSCIIMKRVLLDHLSGSVENFTPAEKMERSLLLTLKLWRSREVLALVFFQEPLMS